LHHNLDKGLLIAGCSEPRFGGGRIITPMRFIVCGRATRLPDGGSAAQVAVDAALEYMRRHTGLKVDPTHITAEIGETSDNLKQVFQGAASMARANDTSFGVAYAPYSALEQCVLQLAGQIRSASFRERFPAAGADFKVMGLRRGEEWSVTVALAFVDRHVDSVAHYFEIKAAMHEVLSSTLAQPARLRLNALDDPQAHDESGLFLTVTGLSAEMGDDGQVGRGNRINGLITPGRPMSLEAAAGKNPVAHVGKLYNVLALLIARAIHEQINEADVVTVQLLSAIGDPIDQPQIAAIEISSVQTLTRTARAQAALIAAKWLSDVPRVTDMILDERIGLF
jgi:S-adenosylmethionine synthetase